MTPPSFEIGRGVRIETVNIHLLGDVDIAGKPTLESIKIDCMFPAGDYPFSQGAQAPYEYVDTLEGWCRGGKVLRFVIPDTAVNLPCRLERFTYGERDGTGDVYAALTLREHKAVGVSTAEGEAPRPPGVRETTGRDRPYQVEAGDTLSAICRRTYGDASLYGELAAYNDIPNPHLIYAGDSLNLPQRERLGG